MNTTMLASAGGVVALIGSIFGGVQVLDARYASQQQLDALIRAALRQEIRELRREVAEGNADPEDLEELIDEFCYSFPEDRLCKR